MQVLRIATICRYLKAYMYMYMYCIHCIPVYFDVTKYSRYRLIINQNEKSKLICDIQCLDINYFILFCLHASFKFISYEINLFIKIVAI